jgi:hypothetical protein
MVIINPLLDRRPSIVSYTYDKASLTATMLQMMVATQHNAIAKGVEWLRNQGMNKFHLVAVTPSDTPLDLMIPNILVPVMVEAYNLMLEAII